MLILGVSASLRNKRFSYKNKLVEDLQKINSLDELHIFVKNQIKVTFSEMEKLNKKELSFEEKYKELKKYKGDRGLSNSETALVYALWQASQEKNIKTDYLSLSNIFENEDSEKLNFFKKKVFVRTVCPPLGPIFT